MSKVVELDDHRPHGMKYIACIECVKDWTAVTVVGGEPIYECHNCGAMAGEEVNGKDSDFFKRYMRAAKNKDDRDYRTMVLLGERK